MFTIIGGDGREYGPATVEQIRAWINAGRANLDTKARAVGSDEWRRLGDFAEFAAPEDVPPAIVSTDSVQGAGGELADRSIRLGAWFLDNVVAFLCCLPGFFVIGFSVIGALILGRGDVGDVAFSGRMLVGWVLLVMGALALLIVQIWMLTTRGQTIGKRLLGIRIVRVADGANPGFVSAVLLRWFVPAVLGMFPYLGLIFTITDILFIFRDDRRCIHDLIAGTRVVKAEQV